MKRVLVHNSISSYFFSKSCSKSGLNDENRDVNSNERSQDFEAKGLNFAFRLKPIKERKVDMRDPFSTFESILKDSKNIDSIAEFIKNLKQSKALDIKDDRGCTLLFQAIKYKQFEAIERLLSAGINVHLKNNLGQAALHVAFEEEDSDTAQFLIQKGIPINVKDKYSMTPLHWAAQNGWLDIIELLVERGAILDEENWVQMIPLQVAIEARKQDIIIFLIERYDVKRRDSTGGTLLHWCSLEGEIEVAKMLISKGVNIDAIDVYGKSALDYAIQERHDDIIELIERAKRKYGE